MSLADSSYPLLNIFWTMFEPIPWLVWIWILTMVFIGISRSHGSHATGAMALPAIGEDVPDRGQAGRFTYLAVRRTSSRGGT